MCRCAMSLFIKKKKPAHARFYSNTLQRLDATRCKLGSARSLIATILKCSHTPSLHQNNNTPLHSARPTVVSSFMRRYELAPELSVHQESIHFVYIRLYSKIDYLIFFSSQKKKAHKNNVQQSTIFLGRICTIMINLSPSRTSHLL